MWREKLKTYIEENGIKKKHIAQKLGITGTTLSNWLSGRVEPSPHNIVKLVETIPTLTYEDFGFKVLPSCDDQVVEVIRVFLEGIELANGHRRQIIAELKKAVATAEDPVKAIREVFEKYRGVQIPPAGDWAPVKGGI